MKENDKNKESSYLKYSDVNNLYGWPISQKLLVNGFECIKNTSQFNEDFIKNYNEESDEEYFHEVDVQYFEKLHELHNDLLFLPERMELEKVEKLVTNLDDKTEYVIHLRNLKQALIRGLVLKKVHRVIKFKQKAWLNSYIDMNIKPREKAKNDFEKYFFKLMYNAVFGKTMENVKKHIKHIKLVTIGRRRNYLVSEPNYHTTKFFTEMYEFWYDYVKPKYGENAKLCYMNTDSFIVHVKADNIYKGVAEDVETRFDTSNFELHKPLPKGKNKKVIQLMKDELVGQIMKELRAKRYSYLKDNNDEDKKAKGTQKCVMKRNLKFQDYKNCLEAAQFENKINHLEKNNIDVDSLKEDQKEFIKNNKLMLETQPWFRSENHNAFAEEIDNIALISNDDKRIQSIESIERYACGMNKVLVCKKEQIKCNNII